jgi:CrcB protein
VPEPPVTPVDSDVDLRVAGDRRESRERLWPVLAAIAAGGVVGALARNALQQTIAHPLGGFDRATWLIDVTGCFLIGVLMVLVTEVWTGRWFVRPFLGVGVLGGFTTFSTYVVDIQQSLATGQPRTALAYLAATLLGALVAVWLGDTVMRGLLRLRRRTTTTRRSRRSSGSRTPDETS